MALTTIDGVLCCPLDEFSRLTTYLGLQEYAFTYGPKYVSENRAQDEFGMIRRTYSYKNGVSSYSPFNYAPDWWVLREMLKSVAPACDSTPPQIGEQDIDGNVYTGGELSQLARADYSLIGPASLGGKIVRELGYRLFVEIQKDKHAEGYAPHEQLIHDVLQPDSPTENK